ncbi:hypothetical protein BS47DRAFT_1346148 [Hydnum rufescens UP504]|uniref:Uncharacterized protein n=1 Tax=Hydnum rufescens UP504 TaxID=1448309 RepID=A0A9P6DUT9_9AGAM|nr:hypothetical protein BS47DRAFT_1346148 [Hydnum rufescens UP504]
MKCVGVGRDFPRDSGSKQAAKAIQQWIAHSANHNPDVPPLDLSYLVPLVVTIEAVAAQEALEGHANPPKSLTNSFDCAMQIARRSSASTSSD